MKKIILMIVAVLVALNAYSETRQRATIGWGTTISCGAYVAANDYEKQVYINWAFGFLSAWNGSVAVKTDFLVDTDGSAIQVNILNYCQKYPLKKFLEATIQTGNDLYAPVKQK